MYAERSQGSIVRSRCKFIEEKQTKYFLNLEKTNNNLKSIHSLTATSTRISKQEDILDAQKQLYCDLYTEPATMIYNDGSLHSDDNLGITWINKPFKTLGIWFALESIEMVR